MSFCSDYRILSIVYIIKVVIKLISISVPIILMVSLIISFLSSIISSNNKDNDLSATLNKAVKKIISAVILFLVPTFVEVVINIIGGVDYNECYDNAQKDIIDIKKAEAEAKKQLEYEKLLELNEKAEEETKENNKLIAFDSIGSGEYTTWRQYDSRWGYIPLGNSYETIRSAGCLVTAIAIQIKRSGVKTSINDFNPGTFVRALNQNRAFDSNGRFRWNKLSSVVQYNSSGGTFSGDKNSKLSQARNLLVNGCYIVAQVKGNTSGSHYVAIVGIKDDNLLMIDPSSDETYLWNKYNVSNTTDYICYKFN